MELKRSLWLSVIPLLVLGELAPRSGLEKETVHTFDCTNDHADTMSCEFHTLPGGSSCSEYRLDTSCKLPCVFHREWHCVFKQCPDGKCCCTLQMYLSLGDSLNATLWKGIKHVHSKEISITDTLKLRAPTIISVKNSNGNFMVTWNTHRDKVFTHFNTYVIGNVTWRKKGEVAEEFETFKPNRGDNIGEYEIPARRLEPSTTYVVSVRLYIENIGLISDRSQEVEFTTSASYRVLILAVILSLSVVAVVITSSAYCCYVKFKAKWWDIVGESLNPALLNMHPSKEQLLKPSETIVSSICVDPLFLNDDKPWSKTSYSDSSSGSQQQSSGISTDSSCLSYANTQPIDIICNVQEALSKAFPQLAMMSASASLPAESNADSSLFSAPYDSCDVRPDALQCPVAFENITYSRIIPGCDNKAVSENVSCGLPIQAAMPCDPEYRPSEDDVLRHAQLDQQPPAFAAPAQPHAGSPPIASSDLQIEFSYQQLRADSTGAEGTGLVSSDVDTAVPGDPVRGATQLLNNERDVRGEASITSDANPCYGVQPPNSPLVEDAYQTFQSVVEQPCVVCAEQSTGEQGEHLNNRSEESPTINPQSFFITQTLPHVKSDAPGVERPFLSFPPANTSLSVITDSGYQRV
ncbi:uncharacterized protein LOC143004966 isoform X1 [Genypterus blacodes]|uniref:uncharacterized protein LOC143004966 isoform X1 n=1 Tax=Genypterus blacodes TaxID=154954 RepID=UPI003F76D9EA